MKLGDNHAVTDSSQGAASYSLSQPDSSLTSDFNHVSHSAVKRRL